MVWPRLVAANGTYNGDIPASGRVRPLTGDGDVTDAAGNTATDTPAPHR
jgi:hypothetical protein